MPLVAWTIIAICPRRGGESPYSIRTGKLRLPSRTLLGGLCPLGLRPVRVQDYSAVAIPVPYGARATVPSQVVPGCHSSAKAIRKETPSHIGSMNLELSDEQTAALTGELHDIVENDRYSFSHAFGLCE